MTPVSRAAATYDRPRPTMELRSFTGALELEMAEAIVDRQPRARVVTRLLTAAIATLDGRPVDAALIRALSSGTRDWLLFRLAASLRPGERWFDAHCQNCGSPYDFTVDLAALPLTDPGPHFPEVTVATSLGKRRFEAPNGGHEEALAVLPDDEQMVRRLTALCGLDADANAAAAHFSRDDLLAIDAALDTLSPQLVELMESRCPTCGDNTCARLDPLAFAFPDVRGILHQIHTIARVYHWSEAAILAMPSARRGAYLEMIAAERRWPTGAPMRVWA